jgi:hypothetical protein
MTTKELPEGIKNADAFKLMDYYCNMCRKLERVWNGRNAASPFSIPCTCSGTMQHANWHDDIRVINYPVPKGQRYFADFTRQRAEEIAKRYIDRFQKTEYALPEHEVEDALYQKIHDLMHDECSMDLLTKE